MSEEKKTKKEEFMIAVAAMNKYLKQNEKEEIVLEGDQTSQMQALLIPIVEEIETGNAENLPVEVIEYYNENFAEEEPEVVEEEPEEKPKKKKEKKEKKEKAPKKERKPKVSVEKDKYNVTVGSGAHKLNLMLEKGASVKDMIDEVGTTRSRVQSHMASLKKKGFFIDNIDGIFTITDTAPAEKPKKEKPVKEKKAKKEKKSKAPAEENEPTEETPVKKKSDKKGK